MFLTNGAEGEGCYNYSGIWKEEEGNSVAIIIPESQFGRYGCFLLMERRGKAAIIIPESGNESCS